MGVNLDDIATSFGAMVNTKEQKLQAALASADPSNPVDMIKLQGLTMGWSVTLQTAAQITQSVGEAVKGIVQKMA